MLGRAQGNKLKGGIIHPEFSLCSTGVWHSCSERHYMYPHPQLSATPTYSRPADKRSWVTNTFRLATVEDSTNIGRSIKPAPAPETHRQQKEETRQPWYRNKPRRNMSYNRLRSLLRENIGTGQVEVQTR